MDQVSESVTVMATPETNQREIQGIFQWETNGKLVSQNHWMERIDSD